MYTKGQFILMLDADGATQISDYGKIKKGVKMRLLKNDNIMQLDEIVINGDGIAIGSRKQYSEEAVRQRKWYRNILGYVFNFLVRIMCGVRVKVTYSSLIFY
jgi:hypothetical protein